MSCIETRPTKVQLEPALDCLATLRTRWARFSQGHAWTLRDIISKRDQGRLA